MRIDRRAILCCVVTLALVASCAADENLAEAPEPLGQFRLGHNIAIADEVTRGPFSREVSETKIEAAVQNAVARRLRRYDGDGLYHLGIVVGGLVLAQPGIPVVYAPNSVMIVDVTIFDNDTRQKLNEKPKRLTVGEGLRNMVPVIGSGLVRSADQQLENLSEALARAVEDWLRDNPEWFEIRPDQVRVPYTTEVEAPQIGASKYSNVGASAKVSN